jgi:hypothetical protein
MDKLIDAQGRIRYGLYDEPVEQVNYLDYALETPMGFKVPRVLRCVMANQFHFAGLIGPEIMVGMAVVDLKFVTNGFVYVYDRSSHELIEARKLALPNAKVSIRPTPTRPESIFSSPDLTIELLPGSFKARARDIEIEARMQTEIPPLRLCTRAGYRGWVYMEKTTPINLSGQVRYRGRTQDISSPAYRGLMDWTTGYMRRDTYWNWAATATTLPDGRSLGLNLSCGVNETSFTENAFWIDGLLTKVDMVDFVYNSRNLYEPWRLTSYDQKVDLSFYPETHRGESVDAVFLKSKFTQLMGVFTGRLRTQTGETIEINSCPGWAEDHYAKW